MSKQRVLENIFELLDLLRKDPNECTCGFKEASKYISAKGLMHNKKCQLNIALSENEIIMKVKKLIKRLT